MGGATSSDRFGDGLSVREIADMLNRDALSLCRTLLPNGKELAGYWNVGSVEGEPGNSLKVHLRGDRMGGWADYSRSEGERGGKGDMLKLVELLRPWSGSEEVEGNDVASAVRWAKQWLGIDAGLNPDQLKRIRDKADDRRRKEEARNLEKAEGTRRRASALWQSGTLLPASPPALAYFRGRGIDFAAIGRAPGAIRFRSDVWNSEKSREMPAILSAMIGADGQFKAVHRTYIDRTSDGRWIKHPGLEEPKKTWGQFKGAHIPLNKGECRKPLRDIPPGLTVEASEGIEDGLSVAMAFPQLRIVAAATLGNIGDMELPPQAGDFTIIGQHDAPGSHAEAALADCLQRQQLRARADGSGRKVLIRWPDPEFKDFNDQLRGVAK